MASTDAKPDLMGKAVTGGRVNADRAVTGALGGAPVNVIAPAITGHAAPGRPAGRLVGHLGPARDLLRLRLAALLRQRRDVDDDRRRHRQHLHPRRVGHRRARARHGHRHQPVRRRELDLGRGRPGRLGRPGQHRPPVISGTPRRGQVLTVTSVWSPTGTSYAYQWQRSTDGVTWTNIGTSAASYTLTTAERGARIRVTVTATNAFGQAVGDQRSGRPGRLGSAGQHDAAGHHRHLAADLHADRGGRRLGRRRATPTATSGSATTAAAGRRSAAPPPRPTGSPRTTRARACACSSRPPTSTAPSELASDATDMPVSPFPPANTVAPALSGTPQRTKTLTATRGTWTGPDNMYTYQWQRDFGEGYVDIEGATGASYMLTAADVDALVRVVVTATNPDGTIVEASEPTTPVLAAGPLNQTPPTVTGSAQRGLTLTGTAGTWGGFGNSISLPVAVLRGRHDLDHHRRRDERHLHDRRRRHRPPSAAAGHRHQPRRDRHAPRAPPTAKVVAAPPVNTVVPTISGAAQRASTLTAGQGTWSGNGNAYTYQWQRDGVEHRRRDRRDVHADRRRRRHRGARAGHRHQPRGHRHRRERARPRRSRARRPSTRSARPSAAPPSAASTLSGAAGTWAGIGNSGELPVAVLGDGTHLDRRSRARRRRRTRSPSATRATSCACW